MAKSIQRKKVEQSKIHPVEESGATQNPSRGRKWSNAKSIQRKKVEQRKIHPVEESGATQNPSRGRKWSNTKSIQRKKVEQCKIHSEEESGATQNPSNVVVYKGDHLEMATVTSIGKSNRSWKVEKSKVIKVGK